jgi:hypothetical protein
MALWQPVTLPARVVQGGECGVPFPGVPQAVWRHAAHRREVLELPGGGHRDHVRSGGHVRLIGIFTIMISGSKSKGLVLRLGFAPFRLRYSPTS